MRKIKDLTNQRFGRLIAKRPTKERRSGSVVWGCKCDCGNLKNENHTDFKEMLEHEADKFREGK